MRDVFRTVAALRSALSTRRNLLLEHLALRHQLGVRARSGRRFRPADRLLWLCLRRLWPRWREARVLVQPATVARWHREGFRGCWRRRSRRPGRPRIASQLRALIRRLVAENRLWGAPRIHGELLMLGIAVSERTVSRYLPDRLMAPSQTWRTLSANVGDLAFIAPVTSSYAPGDERVVDACGLSFRPASLLRNALCASNQCAVVDWLPSLRRTSLGWRVAQDHLHDRNGRRFLSSGAFLWPLRPMNRLRWFARRELDRHRQFGVSLSVQSGRPRRRRAENVFAPAAKRTSAWVI